MEDEIFFLRILPSTFVFIVFDFGLHGAWKCDNALRLFVPPLAGSVKVSFIQ